VAEAEVARVLIVEDTEIVRRALERAVARMGHRTESTSDSVEALAMAVKDPPDLVLLDYRMPRLGGAEVFEEMRASLGERCPKVLFVSATPAEEVKRDVERFGAPAGYVKKPFHLDDLVRVVGEALGGCASG
jgi:two-component system, OmpR family, response regulator